MKKDVLSLFAFLSILLTIVSVLIQGLVGGSEYLLLLGSSLVQSSLFGILGFSMMRGVGSLTKSIGFGLFSLYSASIFVGALSNSYVFITLIIAFALSMLVIIPKLFILTLNYFGFKLADL